MRPQTTQHTRGYGGANKGLSHHDSLRRRKAIAAMVDSGRCATFVAYHFGVHLRTVHKACREHRVKAARPTYLALEKLIDEITTANVALKARVEDLEREKAEAWKRKPLWMRKAQ